MIREHLTKENNSNIQSFKCIVKYNVKKFVIIKLEP